MGRFEYEKSELEFIENSTVPFAIYQFIDGHVVTIAISSGFCELFDCPDFKEAYAIADNDMYRSGGFAVIICAVAASVIGAVLFPRKEEKP